MYHGNGEAFDNSYVQNVHWTKFFCHSQQSLYYRKFARINFFANAAKVAIISSVTQGKKNSRGKISPDGKIHTAGILYVLVTLTLAEESYSASVGVTKNLNLLRW